MNTNTSSVENAEVSTVQKPATVIKFRNGLHSRQKYYGSGLTADHAMAFTEMVMHSPDAFENAMTKELAGFFESLQAGDIVGVVGELMVVPNDYKFDSSCGTVQLHTFTGGTIAKPVLSKKTTDICWANNVELGIYFRAGFVELLYRNAVATDGGQTIDVAEEELRRHIEKIRSKQVTANNSVVDTDTSPT